MILSLTHRDTRDRILVNTDHVAAIETAAYDGGSYVRLADGTILRVREGVSEIERSMRGAGS